jgi:hypothetical protein
MRSPSPAAADRFHGCEEPTGLLRGDATGEDVEARVSGRAELGPIDSWCNADLGKRAAVPRGV